MQDHIYKQVDLVGSSSISSDDAVAKAIAKAAETVRNIHWFQVTEIRGTVTDGKIAYWQVAVKLGFTLEG